MDNQNELKEEDLISAKRRCKKCKRWYALSQLNKEICQNCMNMPPPKYYYDIKVEALVPAILTFRVLAENAEKAAEQLKGKSLSPNSVQYKLAGRRESKLTVFEAGTNMIRFILNLFGR